MAKRERMNVKVDADLVRKAKVVAAAKQVTLSDYVSALLRAQIDSELGQVVARLHAATAGPEDRAAPGPD